MLNKNELKKFYAAVETLDEYFESNLFSQNQIEKIDKIIFFGEHNNLEGINQVMNRNKAISAEELLQEFFQIPIQDINNKREINNLPKL